MIAAANPKDRKLWGFALGFLLLLAIVTVGLWYADKRGGDARELAGSADPADRLRAVDKAREKRDDATAEVLAKLARDRDARVATHAVWALGDGAGQRRQESLRKLLADPDVRPEIRGEAAAALGKFEQTDPSLLTRTLAGEADAAVRAGAAKGLARIAARQKTPDGARQLVPQLSEALEDPDPRVRAWAITGINRLILRRFPYSPKSSPESQRQQVEAIRRYLRERGVL